MKLLWQNFIISLLQTDNIYSWWQHTTFLTIPLMYNLVLWNNFLKKHTNLSNYNLFFCSKATHLQNNNTFQWHSNIFNGCHGSSLSVEGGYGQSSSYTPACTMARDLIKKPYHGMIKVLFFLLHATTRSRSTRIPGMIPIRLHNWTVKY